MKKYAFLILALTFVTTQSFKHDFLKRKKYVVVWQPSHQTDTGKNFSEAETCNAIVEAAMSYRTPLSKRTPSEEKTKPKLKEFKVWSLGNANLHHADSGSNTVINHTTAIIDGKKSGYAYELEQSNKRKPYVFISVHNNGGTKRNAIWGYIHYGDKYEQENRELAARLIKAIASVTDLENRGVLLDSTTGRNNYRCQKTGKLSFYSLDENTNNAPYRVLLEVGDNAVSRELLISPEGRKKMGIALKNELAAWLAERKD